MKQHYFFSFIFIGIFLSLQALAGQTVQRNVQGDLIGFYDKKVFVQKIEYKKEVAILYGIQVIDERGRRYFVENGYSERNALCHAFNFKKAFNKREDFAINTPMTSIGLAHKIVRLQRGDFKPYKRSNTSQVSMIEVLPCSLNSKRVALGP